MLLCLCVCVCVCMCVCLGSRAGRPVCVYYAISPSERQGLSLGFVLLKVESLVEEAD